MKRRDLSTFMGLMSGVIVIAISLIWGQKNIAKTLLLFFDVPSIFIVMFGSFSAIIVAFQPETVKSIPSILHNAFLKKSASKTQIIKMYIEVAQLIRKEGLLSAETYLETLDNNYMKLGLQMTIDGFDVENIQNMMELEIEKTEERHKKCIQVFKMWANLAPSFGMLGTFIGLILMMSNFTDMSKFSSAFATVLVTSFYGAVLSNLVFAPLANKLDIKNSEEMNIMEMIKEGTLSIQTGANPKVMEEKLLTFLSAGEKLDYAMANMNHDKTEKDGKAVTENGQ